MRCLLEGQSFLLQCSCAAFLSSLRPQEWKKKQFTGFQAIFYSEALHDATLPPLGLQKAWSVKCQRFVEGVNGARSKANGVAVVPKTFKVAQMTLICNDGKLQFSQVLVAFDIAGMVLFVNNDNQTPPTAPALLEVTYRCFANVSREEREDYLTIHLRPLTDQQGSVSVSGEVLPCQQVFLYLVHDDADSIISCLQVCTNSWPKSSLSARGIHLATSLTDPVNAVNILDTRRSVTAQLVQSPVFAQDAGRIGLHSTSDKGDIVSVMHVSKPATAGMATATVSARPESVPQASRLDTMQLKRSEKELESKITQTKSERKILPVNNLLDCIRGATDIENSKSDSALNTAAKLSGNHAPTKCAPLGWSQRKGDSRVRTSAGSTMKDNLNKVKGTSDVFDISSSSTARKSLVPIDPDPKSLKRGNIFEISEDDDDGIIEVIEPFRKSQKSVHDKLVAVARHGNITTPRSVMKVDQPSRSKKFRFEKVKPRRDNRTSLDQGVDEGDQKRKLEEANKKPSKKARSSKWEKELRALNTDASRFIGKQASIVHQTPEARKISEEACRQSDNHSVLESSGVRESPAQADSSLVDDYAERKPAIVKWNNMGSRVANPTLSKIAKTTQPASHCELLQSPPPPKVISPMLETQSDAEQEHDNEGLPRSPMREQRHAQKETIKQPSRNKVFLNS